MNKENPVVSIIVRTKDRPKLLVKALQSIAAQTYRPINVVLVNDGGCDLNVEELKSMLGDVSISYIRLEENTGRAHAGNVGIENAKGKYIGFLDDDDEYLPEHIETLITFLEQSDYKIAYTDIEMIFSEFSHEAGLMVDRDKYIFSKDFSYNELLISNYIPFNSVCFSKDILKNVEIFDEEFDLYEDWDLLIRMGEFYPFYHIKKKTALYHQWSKHLQINQADEEYLKATYIKILNKHRNKYSPFIIAKLKEEKEKVGNEFKDLLYKYKALQEKREDPDADVPYYENSIETEKRIKGMGVRIAELEYNITNHEELIKEKDTQIRELENTLLSISNTLGWQILEVFRRWREKRLPPGTFQRNIYDLWIKGFKVLANEGVTGLLQKIKYKTFSDDKKLEELPDLLSSYEDELSYLHFPSRRKFNVLFVKGEWAGLTNYYRVENMIEYLKFSGIRAESIDIFDLPSKVPYIYLFDFVVIHRIPMSPVLNQFIRKCKELHIVVAFDLDDYLFEPSVIHLIEWVKQTKSIEREKLLQHINQCKETFDACDYFICPTDFLATKAVEAGRKAYVIRNGFDSELVQIYSKCLAERNFSNDKKTIKIGYFSGTNTHQKDFHSIAPIILKILEEYPHVTLYVCGFLELDSRFNKYIHKIEKSPFVPLEQLADSLSKISINIAPLEPGNIFCESKSELKYFYAGILKIPTVASATDAFRYAIKDGENGFLASNGKEWYASLRALIEDSSLRKRIGEKAFIHVRDTYMPEIIAPKVRSVYESIINDARLRENISEKSISVNIIVSDVVDNLDKYKNLSVLSKILSKKGHFVRLYFYKPPNISQDSLQKLSSESDYRIIKGTENILSSDISICTDPFNSSVIAYQNKNKTSKLLYFKLDRYDGDIPYKWADLFKVIPCSPNLHAVAAEIECILYSEL